MNYSASEVRDLVSEIPLVEINSNLRILGTAHISSTSVAQVREQIETYQPDVVAVELCKSRYDSLVSGRRLDKEGLLKVIKEGKAPLVLLHNDACCGTVENWVLMKVSSQGPNY